MSIEGRLIHTCTIRTVAKTQNNAGEEVDGTITDVTGVPCLFGQMKGGRTLSPAGEWVARNPTVILPGWVPVTEMNLILGTFAPGFEKTYRIENIESSGFKEITHRVVEIKAVE